MGLKNKPFILLIVVLVSFFSSINVVYSNSNNVLVSELDTNIGPESSSEKIKKLQELFKQLNLYSGEIDGNYSSIEGNLLTYQIKNGIVSSKDSYGAGYFGKKTVASLKITHKELFEDNAEIVKKEVPEQGERYFIVTGYYSPLPGQKRYTTGTYAGDIRLNGSGKITASGKGVFPGLLAAPRNYDFGTKIYLEGIGVGSVEDRGGATVNSGERGYSQDRIDIWMGYGDEGLERALKWGKRTIKGEILSDNYDVNIKFESSPVYKYSKLKVTPKSSGNPVKQLQTLFSELDLYNGDIDGSYESIKDTLVDFQVSNGIVSNSLSEQAGYFGPKTYGLLRKKYPGGIFNESQKVVSTYSLTNEQIDILQNIKVIIFDRIKKKAGNDLNKQEKLRNSLKLKLKSIIEKKKSIKTKNKLKYLNDIL